MDNLTNCVVWIGGWTKVEDPLTVNQNGTGVHVVVLVSGGNKIVQGNVQYTVFSACSQKVVIMYMVLLEPSEPLSSPLSGAQGVKVSLKGRPGGIRNGKGKLVHAGTMTC